MLDLERGSPKSFKARDHLERALRLGSAKLDHSSLGGGMSKGKSTNFGNIPERYKTDRAGARPLSYSG